MEKLIPILSVVILFSAGICWYLSMRQYFKIKAYKEGRKYHNIFIEHTVKSAQYVFNNDFIEYFPLTYLLRKLDDTEYNKYDDVLKKMYNKKAIYEIIFLLSFISFIVLLVISGGFKVTW